SPSAAPSVTPSESATPLPTPTVAGTIAFCKVVEGVEGGGADIYTVRPDGTRLTRLTEYGGWEVSPSWSPDGKHIAYARSKKGGYFFLYASVWVMNADGSGERQLTSRNCYGPSWSPDGTMIAYIRAMSSGRAHVFVMNADGSGQRAVVRSESMHYPMWTPDGRIVFEPDSLAATGPVTVLYAVNPDGSGRERFFDDVYLGGCAVSPDGASLAYDDCIADAMLVGPMRDGSEPVVVLEPVSAYVPDNADGAPLAVAAWRPDGKVLAVATYDPGSIVGSPLYVLGADGTGLSAVPGIDDAMDPAWRPE
ncbi:MAG: hypothetical protein NTX16_11125, partial [Actinobacteria bacterium]|nr:hypothetical protein [Actinomycetota bacterium]